MKSVIVNQLITAIRDDDWPAVKAIVPKIASSLTGKPSAKIAAEFHSLLIEKGHRIREQILDDGLLLDALRILLPAYVGPSITLYRGENTGRWKDGACGFAWTSNADIARMFARGLNGFHAEGGLLLSTDAPAHAIITGPNEHSRSIGEDEYIVDKRKLVKITIVECFPIDRPSYELGVPYPRSQG